jgi:hypothetical protein
LPSLDIASATFHDARAQRHMSQLRVRCTPALCRLTDRCLASRPDARDRHLCAYRGPAFHSETPEPACDQDGGGPRGQRARHDVPGEAAIALHLSAAGAVFERLIILCAAPFARHTI